jgi:hypothetical protein
MEPGIVGLERADRRDEVLFRRRLGEGRGWSECRKRRQRQRQR